MLMLANPKSDYNKMKENVVIVDITSIINNISSVCKCTELFYYLLSRSERAIFATVCYFIIYFPVVNELFSLQCIYNCHSIKHKQNVALESQLAW